MKALSIWQPWASLLASGKKQIETRGWPTKHRGPLLIHAGLTWDSETSSLCVREPFKDALESLGIFHMNPFVKPTGLDFGAIIGRVEIVDCVDTVGMGRTNSIDGVASWEIDKTAGGRVFITDRERAFGNYGRDRFGFLCKDFELFREPYPFVGRQGMFNVPDEIAEKLK